MVGYARSAAAMDGTTPAGKQPSGGGSRSTVKKRVGLRKSSLDGLLTPKAKVLEAPPKPTRTTNLELRAACEANDLTCTRAALAAGASLEMGLTPFGSSALHIAAFDGKAELASMFIEEGAPLDLQRESEGRDTPMILACQNGHAAVVTLLADAGASIHIADEFGSTPLFIASKNGHLEIVKTLIERDAVVDAVAPGLKNNAPLAAAAYIGHLRVVKHLLDVGANPALKSFDNLSAEDYATQQGHKRIAELIRLRTQQRGGSLFRAGPSEGVPPAFSPSDSGRADDATDGLNLLLGLADEQKMLAYRTELLKQVDLLQSLDEQLMPGLAKALVPRSFGPREVIMTIGEPADCMYFVEKGTAEASIDGKVVMTYQDGGFFGEKGLVDNAPRSASVYAGSTGVDVFRLRKDVFDAIKSSVISVLEERQDEYEQATMAGGR